MPGIPIESSHLFYSYFLFFFFFFFLILNFYYLFIYLGLSGNPLFPRCPITLVFKDPQGLLNLGKGGSEPRHILEITGVCVRLPS